MSTVTQPSHADELRRLEAELQWTPEDLAAYVGQAQDVTDFEGAQRINSCIQRTLSENTPLPRDIVQTLHVQFQDYFVPTSHEETDSVGQLPDGEKLDEDATLPLDQLPSKENPSQAKRRGRPKKERSDATTSRPKPTRRRKSARTSLVPSEEPSMVVSLQKETILRLLEKDKIEVLIAKIPKGIRVTLNIDTTLDELLGL